MSAAVSEYQVPPPPRPVVQQQQQQKPYVDMNSGGSSKSPSPTQQRRRSSSFSGSVINATMKMKSAKEKAETSTPVKDPSWAMRKKKHESPEYYEIKSPPLVQVADPFGTMRASKRRGMVEPKTANMDDDDVFLPVGVRSQTATLPSQDPFGTLRANKAMQNQNKREQQLDYRSTESQMRTKSGPENELEITNELLNLLEDFKTKNYSVKEMEVMFDKWRRKAAIYELPEKNKVQN